MGDIKYTLLGDRKNLEKYVKDNPEFKDAVVYEPHPSKEGVVYLHDGVFWFGNLKADDFERLALGELEYFELSTAAPEILKYVTCAHIKQNVKFLEKEAQKTDLDRFKDKVRRYIPSKRILISVCLLVFLGATGPYLSSRIYSTSTRGFSEDFYKNDLATLRLTGLQANWERFYENEKTADKRMTDFTASEVKAFAKEVDRNRLTDDQKHRLDYLLQEIAAYEKK